ncbi:DUF4232 domain-containing protein [Nocardia terpenica]|nr:DUF4232 domain-containing protein [Nocardia terpenica]
MIHRTCTAAAMAAATVALTATAASASPDGYVTKTDACMPANTTVTVQNVERPINHLVLSVTNRGESPCTAYYYPRLRFDGSVPASVIGDSSPQAAVTLARGETAYAAIITSAADDPRVTPASTVEVTFVDTDNSNDDGYPTTVALPDGTEIGPAAAVTYWESDLSSALGF